MLRNGQLLVIDMAVAALGEPLVSRYRDVLFLGAMRADVAYVPVLGTVFEHLSLTHFWRPGLPGGFFPLVMPGPRMMSDRHLARALREMEAGREAPAFMHLGKAAHLVVDMGCPVHASGVVHESDPYEWYVESHRDELMALPVPGVEVPGRASELIASLATITRRYPPERTSNLWGRAMRRLGVWTPITPAVAAEQARVLIPAAAGHVAALLELFLQKAGMRSGRDAAAGLARCHS